MSDTQESRIQAAIGRLRTADRIQDWTASRAAQDEIVALATRLDARVSRSGTTGTRYLDVCGGEVRVRIDAEGVVRWDPVDVPPMTILRYVQDAAAKATDMRRLLSDILAAFGKQATGAAERGGES